MSKFNAADEGECIVLVPKVDIVIQDRHDQVMEGFRHEGEGSKGLRRGYIHNYLAYEFDWQWEVELCHGPWR